MRKKKPNKYDHAAITRDLLASPHKCIDVEVALNHGCVKSYVSTLRKRYTDIRFKTGTPMKKQGDSIETTRVDYLSKLRKVLTEIPSTELHIEKVFEEWQWVGGMLRAYGEILARREIV